MHGSQRRAPHLAIQRHHVSTDHPLPPANGDDDPLADADGILQLGRHGEGIRSMDGQQRGDLGYQAFALLAFLHPGEPLGVDGVGVVGFHRLHMIAARSFRKGLLEVSGGNATAGGEGLEDLKV